MTKKYTVKNAKRASAIIILALVALFIFILVILTGII